MRPLEFASEQSGSSSNIYRLSQPDAHGIAMPRVYAGGGYERPARRAEAGEAEASRLQQAAGEPAARRSRHARVIGVSDAAGVAPP
jgi:hypothetical protein